MDKNGLPWEENDYVKLNICVQINGLKMQQFWTDSLDDPVFIDIYIFTAEVEVRCESGGSADEVGVPEAGGAEAAEAGVGGGQPVDYPGLGLVDQVVGHDVGQQPAQRLHTALQHAQSEACFYITGDKYQ